MLHILKRTRSTYISSASRESQLAIPAGLRLWGGQLTASFQRELSEPNTPTIIVSSTFEESCYGFFLSKSIFMHAVPSSHCHRYHTVENRTSYHHCPKTQDANTRTIYVQYIQVLEDELPRS